MFRGVHHIAVDAKGRLQLPVRVRERLQAENGCLTVTVDVQDQCLLLYPLSVWEEVELRLQQLPSFNPKVRRLQRLIIGHASELEIDGAGRVLIPPALRDYAQLGKKAALVGQGNKLEIWDEARWLEATAQWRHEIADDPQDAIPDELQSLVL